MTLASSKLRDFQLQLPGAAAQLGGGLYKKKPNAAPFQRWLNAVAHARFSLEPVAKKTLALRKTAMWTRALTSSSTISLCFVQLGLPLI